MGAKHYEMRSPEDRDRRRAATARQPKCACGNVLGMSNKSGACGRCDPGDRTDADTIAEWAVVTDPREACAFIAANAYMIGDPYYRDLGDALIAMASRCSEVAQ